MQIKLITHTQEKVVCFIVHNRCIRVIKILHLKNVYKYTGYISQIDCKLRLKCPDWGLIVLTFDHSYFEFILDHSYFKFLT